MTAYHNEFDPYAAAWLRNLIAEGLIPHGHVDERSIADVQPGDLRGYRHVHMFAGIGGWPLAGRLAGWPEDREWWTGSCPCQPFSSAGRRAGTDDPRHLWPDFFRLISACRPAVVMGEQVARKAGMGWLDGVRSDLESAGYASRAFDIPACAVDAPHIRSRLWWCATSDLADTTNQGRQLPRSSQGGSASKERPSSVLAGHDVGMDDTDFAWRLQSEGRVTEQRRRAGDSNVRGVALGDTDSAGLALWGGQSRNDGPERPPAERANGRNGSFWSDAEWIACHDGKARRTKPGLPLLAHGIPARVALWRGFGNAISPVLAAEIIKAFLECQPDMSEFW